VLRKAERATTGAIPLDLADIRDTLDGMVAAQAKVSRKRWANIRSDLAAAIEASGLRPMVRTANVTLDEAWTELLAKTETRIRNGLSRFAHWASLRGIAPEAVDDSVMDAFITEMEAASLTRHVSNLRRSTTLAWNALVGLHQGTGLRPLAVPLSRSVRTRIPWDRFPESFRGGCARIPVVALQAGSARGGSEGEEGAQTAESTVAADAYSFGRERGCCFRNPD
jgi:hypothetical protein